MRKAKVVLKEIRNNEEEGLVYTSNDKGDVGSCFTMAIGYAVQLAKNSNVSLTKVKELVTEIYKETEDAE